MLMKKISFLVRWERESFLGEREEEIEKRTWVSSIWPPAQICEWSVLLGRSKTPRIERVRRGKRESEGRKYWIKGWKEDRNKLLSYYSSSTTFLSASNQFNDFALLRPVLLSPRDLFLLFFGRCQDPIMRAREMISFLPFIPNHDSDHRRRLTSSIIISYNNSKKYKAQFMRARKK